MEGERINDTSKCPHYFHKACLIAWLDKHDVCPCCRCTMITDTEWRYAATQYRVESTSTREATVNEALESSVLTVHQQPAREAEAQGMETGETETSEYHVDQEQTATGDSTQREAYISEVASSASTVEHTVREAETAEGRESD